MFEGALVESRGQLASPAGRWTAAGSFVIQCGIVAVLVTLPLLQPERILVGMRPPELLAPLIPKPPVPPVRVRTGETRSAISAQPEQPAQGGGRIRLLIPPSPGMSDPVPVDAGPMAMSLGTGLGSIGDIGTGSSALVVRALPPGPVRVSSGVSAGMLLSPLHPLYPAIAKAAGIQGAVVLEAVISKSGRIESLHAVSGPEMLRSAALDAVKQARYTPYQLNGAPVEVQTTIVVNFRFGS